MLRARKNTDAAEYRANKMKSAIGIFWAGIAAAILSPACAWGGAVIEIDHPVVSEGNSSTTLLQFDLNRGGDLDSRILLRYLTADGSARAPADYVSLSGDLEVPAGGVNGGVNVAVSGDTWAEDDESLFLRIADAVAVGPAPLFGEVASFAVGSLAPGTGHRPDRVVLGDVNNDGRLDVVTANGSSYTLSVFVNATAPGAPVVSFSAPTILASPTGSKDVTLGDINRDGKSDLVTLGERVEVRMNASSPGGSSPSFGLPTDIPVPDCNPEAVATGDLNNDGKADLAVTCFNGWPAVLINTTPPGADTPSFTATLGPFLIGGVWQIELADYNGDGRLDLSMTGNGSIIVVMNATPPGASGASFGEVRIVEVGDAPTDLAAGDLNGDGVPDIVTSIAQDSNSPSGRPGRVTVLLNTTAAGAPAPSFSGPYEFFAGPDYEAVTFTDVNGDGKQDVSVTVQSSDPAFVQTLINITPVGSNTPRLEDAGVWYIGGWMMAIAAADLNHDGKPDLVAPNWDPGYDDIHVLLNATTLTTDTPAFRTGADFPSGLGPAAVAVGDLNGDGQTDWVAANSGDDQVSARLNDTSPGGATPTFGAPARFAVGNEPAGLVVGDINSDGKPDVVTADGGSGTASVLLNTASADANAVQLADGGELAVGGRPSAVVLSDFNGDGRPDLAVANGGGNDVAVLMNATAAAAVTPAFSDARRFLVGTNPTALAAVDFNHDGRPDIVTANRSSDDVSVLLNTSAPGDASPAFTAARHFQAGGEPVAVAVADINGDGTLDVTVANAGSGTATLLRNTTAPGAGMASLVFAGSFPVGAGASAVVLSDLDNDGKSDLAAANAAGNTISVLRNNTVPGAASFSFSPIGSYGVGTGPHSLAVADFNSDGQRDLLAANGASGDVTVLLSSFYAVDVSGGQGTILDDDSDRTPDPFDFSDQMGVPPGEMIVSSAIIVAGINWPVAIAVAEGEYRINGGEFTGSAGTVRNGDSVELRHIAATSRDSIARTTLTIGGVSATFTSRTFGTDVTPDAFSFAHRTGVAPGTSVVSETIVLSGIDAPAAISVSGGAYSIGCTSGFTSEPSNINPGQTVCVRHITSASYGAESRTLLTVGGVTGTFVSTTAAAPDSKTAGGGSLSFAQVLAGVLASFVRRRRKSGARSA